MQMQTKRMLLRDIRPAAYNPRKRLEPGEKEYEALKGSIERWGLVDPLVVNARTGHLISGHQRYYILTNLGETETEAVAVDLDERQEKLLNVAMNKVEGQWDYGKLETLLSEFETDEILFTGFSEGEIAAMISMSSAASSCITPMASSTVTMPTRRFSVSTTGSARSPYLPIISAAFSLSSCVYTEMTCCIIMSSIFVSIVERSMLFTVTMPTSFLFSVT